MLVFFDCDETTSVLGTSKVKTVLDGDKLVEGTSVIVDYGNAEYKAKVLKLTPNLYSDDNEFHSF